MRATRMVRIGRRLLAAFCLMTSAGAFAQFPSRPVTIIVPATPGGILDQSSRLVAHELAPLIGQPVVVENRAGGGQIIGMQALLRAEPDGHTMVMGSVGPNAANYSLYSKLPYGPADFAPVAHVVSMSNVLLVHPGVPARTVQELVALAKASPGKLSVASSGNGTSSHLAAEMLKWRAGIDLVHVPYKGAAPAMGDLLGGQVQVMVDNLITALPQIKAGKLRALAVTAGQRVPELPDVPTVAESGYPGFEVTVWVGLLTQAKSPPEAVAYLHQNIAKVLAMPHVRQRLAEMGGASLPMSATEFGGFIQRETEKWGTVVRQAGIKVD
ncbi:Bug family tripartite tricarboxylate transporter substrate binding protein [Quisquiliibacterium transsilvanicum]|uniref:Tripartite-type tricarboxylate transporter receptor subunit TctC n=1 Tax=Quisquiliibacterium transsilvanicum TaxID=1549638 RepID=A0A7W8M9D2_9BURK|nr:tripartite tricarboxylate transporter substrate binding protein [Quisquiliibacterium transsilvanicum]MBB5272592.1 tripartite-type tricarboxylate transporter receptor subunit TctC [Quisquiliibacterium transsilvanicum]